MRSLYNFLKELNHLEDWHVVKGEETLYPRTEYSQIEIDTLSYNNIVNYLEELSKTTKNIYSFSTKRAKKSLAWIRKINWKKRRRSSSTEHFVAVYSLHCTSIIRKTMGLVFSKRWVSFHKTTRIFFEGFSHPSFFRSEL